MTTPAPWPDDADSSRGEWRYELALSVARGLVSDLGPQPPPPTTPRRRVALGDPQAPLTQIFRVLAVNDLLGAGGFLRSDVQLLSMGDHFDYRSDDPVQAAQDGSLFLSWLAIHPPQQVTILLGNHDVARVGEFTRTTNATYRAAQQACDSLLGELAPEERRRRLAAIAADNPDWPPLMAAHDYVAFDERQPPLVRRLLLQRRIRLASVERLRAIGKPQLLATHAGVTMREWSMLGSVIGSRDAALSLNHSLDAAVDRVADSWTGPAPEPLDLEPLYFRWTSVRANGGLLIHRPDPRSAPAMLGRHAGIDAAPAPRSVAPEAFRIGALQLVGHTVHERMARWFAEADRRPWSLQAARDAHRLDGRVRTLALDGRPAYLFGLPPRGLRDGLILVDGAMASSRTTEYELLELVPHDRAAP